MRGSAGDRKGGKSRRGGKKEREEAIKGGSVRDSTLQSRYFLAGVGDLTILGLPWRREAEWPREGAEAKTEAIDGYSNSIASFFSSTTTNDDIETIHELHGFFSNVSSRSPHA